MSSSSLQSNLSKRIAVIGPGGQCGSCIVDELLSRGYPVVGLSRNPVKKWRVDGDYSAIALDLNDIKASTEAFSAGYHAIVCAYGPPLAELDLVYYKAVEMHSKIKTALLASDHQGEFIIVGSLHMKHGGDFVDEPGFAYQQWYDWSNEHLNYMAVRAFDHGNVGFARGIRAFQWAKNNIEAPGWFSWAFRPFAWLVLSKARKLLTARSVLGLIEGSRIALRFWEGVTDKQWSFLSPPWLLRDKGTRTGEYEVFVDTPENPAYQGVEGGVYNEDMAVAIVDEVENKKLVHSHWTCTGPIGLKEW